MLGFVWIELLLNVGPVPARKVSRRNGRRPRGARLIDEVANLDDVGLRHAGTADAEILEGVPRTVLTGAHSILNQYVESPRLA